MIILIVGCSRSIDTQSSPQLIKEFNKNIDSKQEAINLLQNWLDTETDFNSNNNKIENVDEYSKYYNLRLTTSIKINGIESGIIGYRDYRISKDGKLYGYYYSK